MHGRQRTKVTQEQRRTWNEASRFFQMSVFCSKWTSNWWLVNVFWSLNMEFTGGQGDKGSCKAWWSWKAIPIQWCKKIVAYGVGKFLVAKASALQAWGPDFESTHMNKAGHGRHIQNYSAPMARWDTETWHSPEDWVTACLVEQNKESISAMLKVRTNM